MSKQRTDLVIFIRNYKFKMMKIMQKTNELIRTDAME